MKRITIFAILLFPYFIFGQDYTVSGKVTDTSNQPLQYVAILVFEGDAGAPISGSVTDENGEFALENLSEKTYRLEFSSIGYKAFSKQIKVLDKLSLETIQLEVGTEELDEAVVIAKKPVVKKEMGKLIFEVENTSLSSGNSLNLLRKTPGVLVIQDQISIKNDATVIYINNRRVYLSTAEIATFLTNLDASAVKSIEVITNPPASYDAEGGSVLNINTTKAISIGYKGSAGIAYEQAVYPKYNINTSHFYKNDWVNIFGTVGVSPRKEFKDQDDRIQFFTPFEAEKATWITDFNRTTRSNAVQANVIADFTVSDKHTITFASNTQVSPNKTFDNKVFTEIFSPQKTIDSTFTTRSHLENDQSNLAFNIGHEYKMGTKGARLETQFNYIKYDEEQIQEVETNYFLPNDEFLRQVSFFTDANQDTRIFTGETKVSTPIDKFSFQAGVKFSDIETQSKLEYTDRIAGMIVPSLSDDFLYEESIFAVFAELSRDFGSWEFSAGLRSEQTDVRGTSRSLGSVNNQSYLEVFPSISIQTKVSEHNTLGLSYARRIDRPRYQSLNPFRYFLNENNFNAGNPNLFPGLDNKVTLSLNHKNTWFFDLYYQKTKNPLSKLAFQDNINTVIRTVDFNLIDDFQYSFDVVFASSLKSWWYLSAYTSSFYLENEFFSEESQQATFSNNTYGFFAQIYNGLTFSKKKSISGDITLVYMSNYIYGSYDYKNQFSTSFTLRKSLWNKRASITLGVDDIFNTNNVLVTSRYYNQDNSYFAKPESRLFRMTFKYNFGNARLRDNQRNLRTTEGDRLN